MSTFVSWVISWVVFYFMRDVISPCCVSIQEGRLRWCICAIPRSQWWHWWGSMGQHVPLQVCQFICCFVTEFTLESFRFVTGPHSVGYECLRFFCTGCTKCSLIVIHLAKFLILLFPQADSLLACLFSFFRGDDLFSMQKLLQCNFSLFPYQFLWQKKRIRGDHTIEYREESGLVQGYPKLTPPPLPTGPKWEMFHKNRGWYFQMQSIQKLFGAFWVSSIY